MHSNGTRPVLSNRKYPHNKNLINLNHLEQGNYILHIKDKEGNQIEAKSFVKIR